MFFLSKLCTTLTSAWVLTDPSAADPWALPEIRSARPSEREASQRSESNHATAAKILEVTSNPGQAQDADAGNEPQKPVSSAGAKKHKAVKPVARFADVPTVERCVILPGRLLLCLACDLNGEALSHC